MLLKIYILNGIFFSICLSSLFASNLKVIAVIFHIYLASTVIKQGRK